jgi:hypothetical protein
MGSGVEAHAQRVRSGACDRNVRALLDGEAGQPQLLMRRRNAEAVAKNARQSKRQQPRPGLELVAVKT